jgi:hypothetical protein
MNPVSTVANAAGNKSDFECSGLSGRRCAQALRPDHRDAGAERAEQQRRHVADQRLDLAPDRDVAHRLVQEARDQDCLDHHGADRDQQRNEIEAAVGGDREHAEHHALRRRHADHRPQPAARQHEHVEQHDDDEEWFE